MTRGSGAKTGNEHATVVGMILAFTATVGDRRRVEVKRRASCRTDPVWVRFHRSMGGARQDVYTQRVCEFCFGDEEKSGLATRPAKLYSTTSALLRLRRGLEQVFGVRAIRNDVGCMRAVLLAGWETCATSLL